MPSLSQMVISVHLESFYGSGHLRLNLDQASKEQSNPKNKFNIFEVLNVSEVLSTTPKRFPLSKHFFFVELEGSKKDDEPPSRPKNWQGVQERKCVPNQNSRQFALEMDLDSYSLTLFRFFAAFTHRKHSFGLSKELLAVETTFRSSKTSKC